MTMKIRNYIYIKSYYRQFGPNIFNVSILTNPIFFFLVNSHQLFYFEYATHLNNKRQMTFLILLKSEGYGEKCIRSALIIWCLGFSFCCSLSPSSLSLPFQTPFILKFCHHNSDPMIFLPSTFYTNLSDPHALNLSSVLSHNLPPPLLHLILIPQEPRQKYSTPLSAHPPPASRVRGGSYAISSLHSTKMMHLNLIIKQNSFQFNSFLSLIFLNRL